MRIAIRFFIFIVLTLLIFLFIDCWQQSVAEKKDGFTETNLWAYYLYTAPEIRHAPELSKDIRFLFQSQDGSRPEISSIVYQGKTEVAPLRAYLSNLGYQRTTDKDEERWQKNNVPVPAFLIIVDKSNNRITLSKIAFN
ncbi:hypothetical protein RIN58_03360 [Siccibacter colletis]|uniref:hypothetical protein n=1 Tax=Siccibacter colletis TaxID=1505757 RepID=UPI0028BE0EAE|nr:hypothetical protein [Siccibacter colletis]WNN49172.1 hypothetical protein RIN58_03360 [Siccibacter colletis]